MRMDRQTDKRIGGRVEANSKIAKSALTRNEKALYVTDRVCGNSF